MDDQLRWQILTQHDKDILKHLNKNREGSMVYQIARNLIKSPKQVYNSLKRLKRLGFVISLAKSPAIWKLEIKDTQKTVSFAEVFCPKCKTPQFIYSEQLTKQCVNIECLTNSKKRTRFIINPKIMISYQDIIRIKKEEETKNEADRTCLL
jgi:Fe2+ or Zn2+ uptake regulation protein